MKGSPEILAFNRGLVSAKALGRLDLSKVKLGAERFTNWWPDSLGPMQLRPGLEYIGATSGNNTARLLPFVFSTDDTAIIELTQIVMRIWVDDELLTRPAVTAVVSNGTFDSNVTSWTDADEGAATSGWTSGGYMNLLGTGTSAAIRYQQVTVNEIGTVHALRIVILRNDCEVLIGTASEDGSYFKQTLEPGQHSIAFTPLSGAFFITFRNRNSYYTFIDSVTVESAGTVSIQSPWAGVDVDELNFDQSGGVVFVCSTSSDYPPYRIVRWNSQSWSIERYAPKDGPFNAINTSGVTLTASATTGYITLTASEVGFFRSYEFADFGRLYRLMSRGQVVAQALSGANQFGNEIRVTGVNDARKFQVTITGTFTATLTLQRSVSEPGDWQDVTTYTTATDVTYDDGLDNQIIYYRIGIKTGNYTSGTATATLTYSSGSIAGVVRLVGPITSNGTVIQADVLSALGSTDATPDWQTGTWCSTIAYPSSVALYEGRLWWAGKDKFLGSITDAFDSFDPDFEGDAGPISRSIGFGPVDSVSWLLPMQRLLAGTDGAVLSCRSSSFDEPITPTNFNVKAPSTQGSARVSAVKVDNRAVYVQRSGKRLYQVAYSLETNDYQTGDLSALVPEIGEPQIIRLSVQRQPDTMIHCVRSDGTVAVLMFEPDEEIRCWFIVETDGVVEDVCVLPGGNGADDAVYYAVRRTINGSTVRYIEKMADIGDCQGGAMNKQLDAMATYSGTAVSTMTGLSHLEAATVHIWADGEYRGTGTVSGGSVSLGGSYSFVAVGLTYTAQWKSTKLALAANDIGGKKMLARLGIIIRNTHAQGISYGRDFDSLDELPRYDENMAAIDQDSVLSEWDGPMVAFPGEWSTDSRLCLQAQAPKPAQILALVMDLQSNR